MYENFLNTYAFEQMAREYNARYNRANIFCQNKDEKIKLKVKSDFKQFSHLFYMLKCAFKTNYYRLKDNFLNFENWIKKASEFLGEDIVVDSNNINLKNNHKSCAIKLMEISESYFKLVDLFLYEDKNYINNDIDFFRNASKLYIEAICSINNFYKNI